MPNIRTRSIAVLLLPLALAFALPAVAQPADGASPPPAWDQLTQAQRDALIAPVRQRWNDHPEKRAHMLAHAERWQDMDPGQRERARRGAERWRKMDPDKREAMRALYARLRTLPEAERAALREEWRAMGPEQRRAWSKANPAPPEASGDR
ncbi:DUF3106 domain-containing protein [Luteimonas terricola]|uniref:DUF3106 domain-containing protein n=1 Tax=Luteimonas terricola TaxID=645597 RepID=A0ABQ2EBI5_9GAMM|nr:DUF3106 domain-containing protein [Luteimonas terricola]GGK00469.1 hypothetical protein GCM10011394_07150 [Luteimonas terricola]